MRKRGWTRLPIRYFIAAMTWSIIARDPGGAFGVAVASKFFAVGAICPHGEGGVGALSTQALPNPLWGYRGMRLLREGMAAQAVVDHVTKPDVGAEQRQFHVHDAKGGIAVHTGARCIDWCGHVVRSGVSVAGNMLAGPDVVAATAHAFETSAEKSFVRRLIAAMKAGEAKGGDKRGKQSAAIVIWTTEEYPAVSLRVDDHSDPLAELARLESIGRQRLFHYVNFMPSRAHPNGTLDRDVIEAGIAAAVAAQDN
jgi:uncharacterized Ntn-hydrolase superfamily protein